MNIIHFTHAILSRGGTIENLYRISVVMNNSRFNLLTNEYGEIGVEGFFCGEYGIRTCWDFGQVLFYILGYAWQIPLSVAKYTYG